MCLGCAAGPEATVAPTSAGQIEFSAATLPVARQGITTALDRPILRAAVEATFHQMFSDGTYRAILIQHLPNDESVAIVSILE